MKLKLTLLNLSINFIYLLICVFNSFYMETFLGVKFGEIYIFSFVVAIIFNMEYIDKQSWWICQYCHRETWYKRFRIGRVRIMTPQFSPQVGMNNSSLPVGPEGGKTETARVRWGQPSANPNGQRCLDSPKRRQTANLLPYFALELFIRQYYRPGEPRARLSYYRAYRLADNRPKKKNEEKRRRKTIQKRRVPQRPLVALV